MVRRRKPSGRRLPDKGRRTLKRPVRRRDLRPRFLIVCEGEKTEPNYFRSFPVSADVKVVGIGFNTTSLVKKTKEMSETAKRQGAEYTDVWVVFDSDDFPRENFNEAIRRAQQSGIKVAYSNEAFELWYVLHFHYMDNAISRKQYQEIIAKKLNEPYRKNDALMYRKLLKCQNTAIRNAENLLELYKPNHNPAKDKPCTTVHLLVKELNRHIR